MQFRGASPNSNTDTLKSPNPASQNPRPLCVALVDGDPSVRRARQLLFRSENYTVCSYASCPAIIADSEALCCDCIVADAVMQDIGGPQLIDAMCARGWRGATVLLADVVSSELAAAAAAARFTTILPKKSPDGLLLASVAAAIARYRSQHDVADPVPDPMTR